MEKKRYIQPEIEAFYVLHDNFMDDLSAPTDGGTVDEDDELSRRHNSWFGMDEDDDDDMWSQSSNLWE